VGARAEIDPDLLADKTVNKRELARLLGVSLPTLTEMIDRYPDFPVEGRGTNGREWEFDAEKAVRFVRDKRDQTARAREDEQAFFRQFTLDVDVVAEEERGLRPADRERLAKARMAERKLALEAGMLVSVAEVRQILAGAVARFARSLDGLPSQIAREYGLPEEVARSMRQSIDDWRRAMVTDLRQVLTEDAGN
jgi:phage terminase Nu1 subunit (DNA packaging protein)